MATLSSEDRYRPTVPTTACRFSREIIENIIVLEHEQEQREQEQEQKEQKREEENK